MLQNLTFTEESDGMIAVGGAADEYFMIACMKAIARYLVQDYPNLACGCAFCKAMETIAEHNAKPTSH